MNLLDQATLLSEGSRHGEEGSWTRWCIFDRRTLPDNCDEDLISEVGYHSYYRGPGRQYANQPYVWRTSAYVVVEHSGGLDI